MAKYTIPSTEDLLEAGVHFGHQTRRWHPKMEPYIFGVKRGLHIIDLGDTHKMLQDACDALYNLAANGGQIVFLGTKKQAQEIVKNEANRSGALYVNDRWLGGTITNFEVVRKNMKRLVDLTAKKEKGELEKYTKKERLLIDRDIDKLERSVGGILGLTSVPAALFIIDPRREKTAIKEANKAGVKTIALIDTNSDPAGIDHLIPGNDDAIKAIALIVKAIGDAVFAGYKEFEEKGPVAAVSEGANTVVESPAVDTSATKVSVAQSPIATEKAGKKVVKEVVKELETEVIEDVEKVAVVEKVEKDSKDVPEKPKRGRPKKSK